MKKIELFGIVGLGISALGIGLVYANSKTSPNASLKNAKPITITNTSNTLHKNNTNPVEPQSIVGSGTTPQSIIIPSTKQLNPFSNGIFGLGGLSDTNKYINHTKPTIVTSHKKIISKKSAPFGGLFKNAQKNFLKYENTPFKKYQYDVVTSNPVTKYIQATAIRNTLNNKNSKYYNPSYKNTKVIYTNNLQTTSQLKKQNPNYKGSILDVTPTQTIGQYINMPKINSSNNLGTNDNSFDFKKGYQGEGYYNNINKLALQVYVLNKNMYNQLSKKNYSSVTNTAQKKVTKKPYEPFGGLFKNW